jgi:hypothetical protein
MSLHGVLCGWSRRVVRGSTGAGLWLAAALAGAGCVEGPAVEALLTGERQPLASAEPPIIEPLFGPPDTTPSREDSPAWIRTLPQVAVRAKVGDKVWATVPEASSELTEPSMYTLVAISDGAAPHTAELISRNRRRLTGVPAALVHPIGPSAGLRVGSAALISTFTTPGILARITQLEPGKPIRARYDWAGQTREIDVDHAERPRRGVTPMAYVGYPKLGRISLGLVVAKDDDHAWLWTSSGHVERHPRKKLQPLTVGTGIYQPGDRVRAFRWSQGLRRGTISEVLESELRYRVHFRGNRPSETFFFSALLPR